MRIAIGGLLLATLALVACGSSGDGDEADDLTPAGVQACLEDAGFGVTVLPAQDVAEGAAHNRGPGQTGELLVGANGAQPAPESDEADAVVAFWDSDEHASTAPGVEEPTDVRIDVFGSISVQPVSLRDPAELESIESCAQ